MATEKASHRTFKTHIDIPADKRKKIIEHLNLSLATTLDLFTQIKQAHWNVKGKDFIQLHELFDEIAGEIAEFVDKLAERATTLGGYANGTARMAAANSVLHEYPTDVTGGMEHVAALVERFGQYAHHVRASIDETDERGDKTTADLYTEISRTVDMRLWFLEAHLQG